MGKGRAPAPNLLECIPRRQVQHEVVEELVVLLRPRFMSGPLARWLLPHLKRPNFRVRLDALGSLVWLCCDGQQTVGRIAEAMARRHPDDDPEQLFKRLQLFLAELERGKMIQMELPGAPPDSKQ